MTQIYSSSMKYKPTICKSQTELQKIYNLFKLNKLSLNIKNNNLIMFSNKNKIINTQNLNVLIDNIIIDLVYNTKLLSVIINSNLTWNDHIKAISRKVSKSISILLMIRKKCQMSCY